MAKYQSTLTGQQMDAALAAMPDAEAYAKGTRNGQDVPSSDPTYHNNAKYYSEEAARVVPSPGVGAVRYDVAQVLSATEKAQAKSNMGVVEVQPSNRNLLDNPWFTVNQRGATTYNVGAYGVDRWKLISGGATISGTLITLSGTLRQILEFPLGTNDVTCSVKCLSGTATVSYNDSTQCFDIVSSGGVIGAVKLELGSVSTLSNDIAPNYAEELAKCMRYYQKFSFRDLFCVNMYGYSSTTAIGCFQFLVPMRVAPSLTGVTPSSWKIQGVGNLTSLSLNGCTTVNCGLNAVVSSGITSNRAYALMGNNVATATLEFTADL